MTCPNGAMLYVSDLYVKIKEFVAASCCQSRFCVDDDWTTYKITLQIQRDEASDISSCFDYKDTIFTIVTWAGHLNSMLNPLIYSRFSRDFRRAFKQILTCQREQKVKTAFKTPLSLVFTQLIS
ncbi:hypothetical protein TELCIR_20063, partial [Teladorsagia circumcincta]